MITQLLRSITAFGAKKIIEDSLFRNHDRWQNETIATFGIKTFFGPEKCKVGVSRCTCLGSHLNYFKVKRGLPSGSGYSAEVVHG